MRSKVAPAPPGTLGGLAAVRDALPRVPRPEADCCGRLVDRVARVEDREAAREWLVFLRALGLARRTRDGAYVRGGAAVEPTELAPAFRRRVHGAEAVIDALDDEPRAAGAVFEAVRDVVPEWERRRTNAWPAIWRERVERLLAWAVLLELAARREVGYVARE